MNIDTDKLSNYDRVEKISFIVNLLDELALISGEYATKLACKFYLFSLDHRND